MAARRIPAGRVLIGASALLLAIGVAALVYYLIPALLGPHGGLAQPRTVRATVSHSAACGAADPYDAVAFTLDGHTRRAKLNGCGHDKGATLRVSVPAGADGMVQPARATAGTLPGGYRRLGAGLLALGCLAGTGCAFLIRYRGARPTARTATGTR